jgi:ABC-type Fe3+/spermidine/putrescine transport system ATPase subunit
LQSGTLIQVGTPAALYRQPVSLHVARLFGEVNAIDAQTAGALAPALELKAAQYMIRPEALRFGGEGVPGEVTGRRYRGVAWRVMVALDSGVTLMADVADAPEVSARVQIAASPGDLHAL